MKKIFLFCILFLLLSCNTNIVDKDNVSLISTEKNEELDIKIINDNLSRIEKILIREFKAELLNNNSFLIDLRTKAELIETWIISWASNIDFYNSNFTQNLDKLNKEEQYLVYCRSWNRSSQTLSIMKDLGFRNVLELQWWINNWISSWEETVSYN